MKVGFTRFGTLREWSYIVIGSFFAGAGIISLNWFFLGIASGLFFASAFWIEGEKKKI